MWRKRKVILIEILVVVMLVATLGAVAIARADDESTSQNNISGFIEKVAEIYQQNTGTAIDPQALENAFTQARQQQCTELRNNFLDKLVEQGKITQEQADEFEAWLDARPDNILTDEFQQWLEARPDIMGMFGQHNAGGMMFFGKGNGRAGFGVGQRIQLHDCWSE